GVLIGCRLRRRTRAVVGRPRQGRRVRAAVLLPTLDQLALPPVALGQLGALGLAVAAPRGDGLPATAAQPASAEPRQAAQPPPGAGTRLGSGLSLAHRPIITQGLLVQRGPRRTRPQVVRPARSERRRRPSDGQN